MSTRRSGRGGARAGVAMAPAPSRGGSGLPASRTAHAPPQASSSAAASSGGFHKRNHWRIVLAIGLFPLVVKKLADWWLARRRLLK